MATQDSRARWLAGTVLLLAALELLRYVAGVYASTLARTSAGASGSQYALLVFDAAAVFVFLVVEGWFWVRASGLRGERLFVSALVCTVLAQTLSWGAYAVVMLVEPGVSTSGFPALNTIVFLGFGLTLAGTLFFAVGLLRSGFAPAWVGWFGVAAAALSVLAFPSGKPLLSLPEWASSVSVLGLSAFLLALGMWLVKEGSDADGVDLPRAGRMSAALGALFILVVAVGFGAAAFGSKTVAKNSAPVSHFPAVFARLFPGFGHDGDLPELENVDELNALEQFSIERSGSVVMQIDMSNDRSLVSTVGPIHGRALTVSVPSQGTWYMGDSYFVDDRNSEFQCDSAGEEAGLVGCVCRVADATRANPRRLSE